MKFPLPTLFSWLYRIQESTSELQGKARDYQLQEKLRDFRLPQWVLDRLESLLGELKIHVESVETSDPIRNLPWRYNMVEYDTRGHPLLCIPKEVQKLSEIYPDLRDSLGMLGNYIYRKSMKTAGIAEPTKTAFICAEENPSKTAPAIYEEFYSTWRGIKGEPELLFLSWPLVSEWCEPDGDNREKCDELKKSLMLEELKTPETISQSEPIGEHTMDCFTQEQFIMARNGLQRSFQSWLDFANMLAEVANTPKVQQYPNSHIAKILRNLEPRSPSEAGVEVAITKILPEIRANNLCRELVKTAHEWAPYNEELEALNRQFMRIKAADPGQEDALESLLNITIKEFLNPVTFAKRLGPIRYRVCRIEIGAKDARDRDPYATGFLVGPDLVLTNHHVIEDVLEGKLNANQFVFGFDRVEWEDGTRTSGPTYGLNMPSQQDEWLLAMSETDALDYALLRLDTQAGELPILSNTTNEQAAKRGWLALSEVGSRALKKGTQFIIFQHPAGLPLRLDIREVGEVLETRVTYTTNTMQGSSGSPCFDGELRLCALHHAGPNGALNQGIRVGAILADLEQKKLKDKVCIESP